MIFGRISKLNNKDCYSKINDNKKKSLGTISGLCTGQRTQWRQFSSQSVILDLGE